MANRLWDPVLSLSAAGAELRIAHAHLLEHCTYGQNHVGSSNLGPAFFTVSVYLLYLYE